MGFQQEKKKRREMGVDVEDRLEEQEEETEL